MSGSEKEALLNVFAALVRPLMRAAFEYGISAGEIASVVRRVYIQSLEARLVEQKRPTTDARLAVVSGLTRSDVAGLREGLRSGAIHGAKAGASPQQIASLLTAWHTHPNFSGAYGLPLDVDVYPLQGSPRHSFQELVDIACPGIDRDALLDELVAARSVEIVDSTTIRCLSRAYVPRGVDITRIERMGRFLAIVTDNFVHNLLRGEDEPAYFERAVVSDEPISTQARDRFLKVGGEKGQELLAELDTFLTGLAAEEGQIEQGMKYGVGIYFFEDKFGGNSTKFDESNSNQTKSSSIVAPQEIDVLAALGMKSK